MAKYTQTLADTPLNRRMASGHLDRKGHKLQAVQSSDDGILWHTVYLCCGETIPATVETWEQHVPTPDSPTA